MPLILGSVVFQDHEIPASIPFGGRQRMAIHKYIGGSRVIDAMGPDDAPIPWSGQFRGFQARDRARTLDLMRRQGLPLVLSWDVFTYRVVISEFTADFQAPFEIPYRITCEIASDEASQVYFANAPSIASSISSGLSDALGISIDSEVLAPIVTAARSSVESLATNGRLDLEGLSSTAMAGLRTSIGSAVSAVDSYTGGLADTLGGTGLGAVVGGGDPSSMAGIVTSLAGDAIETYRGQAVGSLLRNVGANLGRVGL